MPHNHVTDHSYSAIYHGTVRHARYMPKKHRFAYKVFSLLLDIDQLETLSKNLKLFSFNRFNIFSFRTSDHGAKDGSKLRPFIEKILDKEKIKAPDNILVMCYPRIFGYVFNPITVYYCLENNKISAMIYEVNNTFGEDHIYVVSQTDADRPAKHNRRKKLHVSPFISMDAEYSFTTDIPGDELKVIIREKSNNAPLLLASFIGHRATLNDKELLKAFFRYPLMTMKIVFGIHYEALRLILKGVIFIKRPTKETSRITYS